MNRTRRLVRNLLTLTVGEAGSKVLGLVAFAWVGRSLGPSAYGAVELVGALAVFFALVVDLGLGPVGARDVASDPGATDRLSAQIPAARLILSVGAVAAMLSIAGVVSDDPRTLPLALWFAAGLPAVACTQVWLFQGHELMGHVSLGQFVRAATFAGVVFLLVRTPDDLLRVGLAEMLAAVALATFLLVAQGRRFGRPRLSFDRVAIRRLLSRGVAVGLSEIVWAANQYLPTLMVAALAGSGAIGPYGAAQRILISGLSLSRLYHFNLYPSIARSLHRTPSYDGLMTVSFRLTAWAGVGAATLLTVLARPIAVGIYGPDFAVVAGPLAVLVWAFPVQLLSGHARWSLIAAGWQRHVLAARLLGAVVTVTVGATAIPWLGATGASITMVASSLAVWGMVTRAATRLVRPLPSDRVVAPLVLAAGVLGLLALGLSPVLHATLAVAVFTTGAVVLEPALVGDARTVLAEIRGAAGPRDLSHPGA